MIYIIQRIDIYIWSWIYVICILVSSYLYTPTPVHIRAQMIEGRFYKIIGGGSPHLGSMILWTLRVRRWKLIFSSIWLTSPVWTDSETIRFPVVQFWFERKMLQVHYPYKTLQWIPTNRGTFSLTICRTKTSLALALWCIKTHVPKTLFLHATQY